jgi:hypothetical protein
MVDLGGFGFLQGLLDVLIVQPVISIHVPNGYCAHQVVLETHHGIGLDFLHDTLDQQLVFKGPIDQPDAGLCHIKGHRLLLSQLIDRVIRPNAVVLHLLFFL